MTSSAVLKRRIRFAVWALVVVASIASTTFGQTLNGAGNSGSRVEDAGKLGEAEPTNRHTGFAAARTSRPSPVPIWTDYIKDPDRHPNIPNVSYAGFRNGDEPLPFPTTNIVNVKLSPYHAKGDGVTDDTGAIRAAISDVGAGGAVIFFPQGTYLISDVIFVHRSGTILRGESRERTTLHFAKSLTDAYGPAPYSGGGRSWWSWSGGLIWFTPESKHTYRATKDPILHLPEDWMVGDQLATITSAQMRGDRTFEISPTRGIRAGDYVLVRVSNLADASLRKHLAGDGSFAASYPWDNPNINDRNMNADNMPHFDWPVRVAAVSGKTVTLVQPLRFDLRPEWSPKVMEIGDTIRECGVEQMTIRMARDYEYFHDQHHNREPGWNGPWFLLAIDCFVRDVTVLDSDTALAVCSSKNITFTDFKVGATAENRMSHHHATYSRRYSQDCLWENFEIATRPRHGLGTENFSMGHVWSNGIMRHGTFDSHGRMPSESVRTGIRINNDGFAGGGGLRHGARVVHWNIEITNDRNYILGEAQLLPKGAIVGVRGAAVSSPILPERGDSECYVYGSGPVGEMPYPPNLYEAQKAWRHGRQIPVSR